jgi:spermidine/putrescine transport system permease protein
MVGIALSRYSILIAHIAFNISFVAVIVRARLATMDDNLEEAAADLGANEWTTFRRITLPLLMPGIVAGALLAFTLSLDDFVITFFVSGPGSTTLPVRVYSMIKFGVTPEVNAISTLMLLGSTFLVIISLAIQRR